MIRNNKTNTVSLGDVIAINPDSLKVKDCEFSYIEYIDISSVGSGVLMEKKVFDLKNAPSRARRLVKSYDTILSTVRPNLRAFLLLKKTAPNLVVSTGFSVLRATSKIDKRFLYYTVTNQEFTDYLTVNAKGAAYPAVDVGTIKRAKINLPPLPTQQKIAAILSAYDDLIENNNRRIEILEEMARMLYREWFVKFRYPGHESDRFYESELGLIPEGWEVVKVDSIVKRLKAGKTYKESEVEETGKVLVIDQSRKAVLGFHNNKADHFASVREPIIIFGDHTCKMQLMTEPFSLGPNVVPFVSKNKLPISYLYFLVSSLVETIEYKRHWTELKNKKVVVSNCEQTNNKFVEFTRSIFKQVECLRKRNFNLSQTRDLLLPRLISGEIDVEKLDIKGINN